MRLKITLAATLLAALSACAPTDFASTTETRERTLTVREIDPETRTFAVTGDGQRFNIRVSEAVVNFDQIEVGDRLNIVYTDSVAVSMALPGDTGETVAVTGAAAAPVGARPGLASGQLISAVVTFVAYDPRSHSATLRTQSGELLIANVPRDLRRFAAARQPGDQIEVALSEAFAVAITPAT